MVFFFFYEAVTDDAIALVDESADVGDSIQLDRRDRGISSWGGVMCVRLVIRGSVWLGMWLLFD